MLHGVKMGHFIGKNREKIGKGKRWIPWKVPHAINPVEGTQIASPVGKN